MMELENSSPTAVSTASGEASASTGTAAKKKRNLPGTPHPDAEVIALSPKTLMATNRFVCEICSKGFQRDQNLQLHRRGHNLPWKLKQRANKEIRKKVYVCPETTCVHNDPRRALGDLTGIKKHFCRKHGEKKWKCERCSKTYAVLSDWKAHMKTCGTKEYICDCGTLFSRKDSFITHRAFCDALAQESARAQPVAIADSEGTRDVQTLASPPSSPPLPPPLTPSTGVLSPVLSIQSSEVPENPAGRGQKQPVAAGLTTTTASTSSTSSGNGPNSSSGVLASIFAAAAASSSSSSPAGQAQPSQSPSSFSDMLCAMAGPERHRPVEQPMSLSISSSLYLSNNPPSPFPTTNHSPYGSTQQPALSATALLQKAAQIGARGSSSSFLRALGLEPSSMGNQNTTASTPATSIATAPLWNGHIQPENNSVASGLGLGLPTGGASGLTDLIYANNNPTVDFLGLGIGAGGGSSGGFSALLTSIGGGLDVSTAGATASFGRGTNSGDQSGRKPSSLL